LLELHGFFEEEDDDDSLVDFSSFLDLLRVLSCPNLLHNHVVISARRCGFLTKAFSEENTNDVRNGHDANDNPAECDETGDAPRGDEEVKNSDGGNSSNSAKKDPKVKKSSDKKPKASKKKEGTNTSAHARENTSFANPKFAALKEGAKRNKEQRRAVRSLMNRWGLSFRVNAKGKKKKVTFERLLGIAVSTEQRRIWQCQSMILYKNYRSLSGTYKAKNGKVLKAKKFWSHPRKGGVIAAFRAALAKQEAEERKEANKAKKKAAT
jgi:hypothetical protein